MAGSVAQEIEEMTKIGDSPVRAPKRFYKTANVERAESGYFLALDGRPAKTRAGRVMQMRSSALAEGVAQEWNAQAEHIEFARMPMTRFAMTVADLGESDAPAWRETVLSFLKSDLLCYRAIEPAALSERQNTAWNPILSWAENTLGLRLMLGAGVSFVAQPREAIEAASQLLSAMPAEKLLGVKAATEISGSAVIAFALNAAAFSAGRLFEASRVDERFQSERWGVDSEAADREEKLRRDFEDAALFLSIV